MGKTYTFVGTKSDVDNTELIDMNDGRVAAKGQTIELSDEEAEQLKASGLSLRVADEQKSEAADKENSRDTGNSR